jgi:hypothetical protein
MKHSPFSDFLLLFFRSCLMFFRAVSPLAVLPKMVDAPTLTVDGSFRPGVLGPSRAWSHGRCNPIYTGCCCIPAASLVSSRRLPPVFRTSVVFFFTQFVEAVLSKVAGALTVLVRNLSVIFSFHLVGLAPPECPGRRLLEPGGRSCCYIGYLQLKGLIEGLAECVLTSQV